MLKAETVYIPEGEKDAERIRAHRCAATTNPHGAGNWRDEYSETLAGKDVVIFPDNDESGRKHAEQVARSLYGKARSIKIVELPGPSLKGDISDFLAQFADPDEARERLSIIIEGAGPYKPPPGDPGDQREAPGATRDRDRRPKDRANRRPADLSSRPFLEAEDFINKEMPPKLVYLDPWLMAQSIILITGQRGIGKSWVLLPS